MKKKNNDFYIIILIIITILLMIINLIIYLKKFLNVDKNNYVIDNSVNTTVVENEKSSENTTVPQTDEEIKKYLSSLGERDRMEYYCGEYFKFIKHQEYESAYNLLYDDFKNQYFPTLEKFEKYVQELYPEQFALQYDDITRQGTIYVLRLKIIDANNTNSNNENIQRIVVQENDYNNFVLSFQVK